MSKILIILFCLCALSACVTPMRLGISETQWQNYSPEERQKIKSGYYAILKNKVNQRSDTVPDGSILNLKISDGETGMPPFTEQYCYSPVEVEVPNGNCRTVKLLQPDGDKSVAIQICYMGKTAYIDPSRFDPSKRLGSIQLHYSPIWDRGFTYQNVSSSGYAHLKNVNVAVRRYDNNESVGFTD